METSLLFKTMTILVGQLGIVFVGAYLFILFLLADFSLLADANESGLNDWSSAFNFAFQIYLDIINLLLQILDAMSN